MTGLKLGIVKPDHGFVGGFELHVDALTTRMRQRGHDVTIVSVPATGRSPKVFGYPVAPVLHEWHSEYFRYLEMLEATRRLDLSTFDVVCSTQPPTYAAPHPRVFSLTYHQYRVFYDLADEYVAAGFVSADAHKVASEAVQQMDADAIEMNRGFLAGSDTIADRLERYWNVGSLPYRHPNVTSLPPATPRDRSGSDILCVSRQEWPKRTELFVAAMHLTAARRGGDRPIGHLVGGGSRSEFVESLDRELCASPDVLDSLNGADAAAELWRNMGIFTSGWQPVEGELSQRVRFHGSVSEDERNRLYRESVCVVAPALDEDYGLTVLEAWQQQRPIVVCRDGGGLTELVQHGVNGLVVAASPFAIAQAIDRLCNDPDLADELVQGGLESLSGITWHRALDAFEQTAINAAGGIDGTTAPPIEGAAMDPEDPQRLTSFMAGLDSEGDEASVDLLAAIRLVAAAQTTGGHTAQIGLTDDRLFTLLALICGADERAVGFDPADADRSLLQAHLQEAGVQPEKVVLEAQNPLRLQPDDVAGLVGGRIRLFVVDPHADTYADATTTANDLWLAERCMTPGGVVVLRNAFNPTNPAVNEGMHNYLRHRSCGLIPFGSVNNSVLFTNDEDIAGHYREVLQQPFQHHDIANRMSQAHLYGSEMICVSSFPVAKQ